MARTVEQIIREQLGHLMAQLAVNEARLETALEENEALKQKLEAVEKKPE